MKKHLKSFDDFSLNEGIFDIFRSKKEMPPSFGYSPDKSKDSYLKSATHSQINITYETSWDASFVIDIQGELVTESRGNYIITPKKITVTPTYNNGYGAKYKAINFPSYPATRGGTDGYLNNLNLSHNTNPLYSHHKALGVDELYSKLNERMQKYLGNDLKLSFYKLDLESWAEKHSDPHFISGKKTPTWVKDNLKLPFIEDGELPETNLLDDRNRLKEAIWVSIPEMSFAMAMPGNGILRKISVYSTEMW